MDLSLFPPFVSSGPVFTEQERGRVFEFTLKGDSSVKETYGLDYSKGGSIGSDVRSTDCGLGDIL